MVAFVQKSPGTANSIRIVAALLAFDFPWKSSKTADLVAQKGGKKNNGGHRSSPSSLRPQAKLLPTPPEGSAPKLKSALTTRWLPYPS